MRLVGVPGPVGDSGPADARLATREVQGPLQPQHAREALGPVAHAGHHTPASFARQCAELPAGVTVIAVHLKPRYRARILSELAALGLPRLEIGSPREGYAW